MSPQRSGSSETSPVLWLRWMTSSSWNPTRHPIFFSRAACLYFDPCADVSFSHLCYAMVDGLNVRDSRVHNYPPRWNDCPAQCIHMARICSIAEHGVLSRRGLAKITVSNAPPHVVRGCRVEGRQSSGHLHGPTTFAIHKPSPGRWDVVLTPSFWLVETLSSRGSRA